MVDKPNMPVPPAPTGLKKAPKIEAPELATSASQSPKYTADPPVNKAPDIANKDRGTTFKLPEKITAAEVRDGSFKYGGGRSAGNRSFQANQDRLKKQP